MLVRPAKSRLRTQNPSPLEVPLKNPFLSEVSDRVSSIHPHKDEYGPCNRLYTRLGEYTSGRNNHALANWLKVTVAEDAFSTWTHVSTTSFSIVL